VLWAASAASLVVVAFLLPGFWFDTAVPWWWTTALLLPLIFSMVLLILRPVLVLATLPLNFFTLGLPTLLFNGVLLYYTALVLPAFHIGNILDAFVGLVLLSILNTLTSSWLGIDEVYPLFQTILRRLGKRIGPKYDPKVKRGMLILQIDGLSWRVLMQAMRRGRLPTLSAVMGLGRHRLFRWQSGIPSNTPAVQGGLFYGQRGAIPGYRWYDRQADRVMVSSDPNDIRQAEEMAAAGVEGLLSGGSCINSLFSGGADKQLMTLCAYREEGRDPLPGEHRDFSLFWLSPNAYTSAALVTALDLLIAFYWHIQSRFSQRKRKIRRTFMQAWGRAIGNAFLRETAFFWLEQDVARGVPIIYSNFIGYDEVAHHAGSRSFEAMSTLVAFDRKLQKLRRQIKLNAPIAYDVVILSDHGQSDCIPFSYQYGRPLEDLIGELGGGVASLSTVDQPGSAYVAALLGELRRTTGRRTWLEERSRRALERFQEERSAHEMETTSTSLMVCASGGLAHVYRRGSKRKLNLAEIDALYPGLVEGLAGHPGIAFVMVRDADDHVLLVGGNGVRDLTTGTLVGDRDPLAPFWDVDLWTRELLQIAACEMAGDMIVNGAVLPGQTVISFEEQLGTHGGLGGAQNEPFVILPNDWQTVRSDLISPEALYRHLKAHKGPH
jgi:uncharacterized membrane protein YvlD (DUF360 family)